MPFDRVFATKLNDDYAKEIAELQKLLGTQSQTLRYLIKVGIISVKLLTSDESKTDIDLETVLDKLTPERQRKMLELIIDRLGEDEVTAIRGKKARQLMEQRLLTRSDKDKATLERLAKPLERLDGIDFHELEIKSLCDLKDRLRTKSFEIDKYLRTLILKTFEEGSTQQFDQLNEAMPDIVANVLKMARGGAR